MHDELIESECERCMGAGYGPDDDIHTLCFICEGHGFYFTLPEKEDGETDA